MKRFVLWFIFAIFNFHTAFSQNKEKVIKKVWLAVGGKLVFEKARYWQFSFAVDRDGQVVNTRNHTWDRYTVDYRLGSKSADEKLTTVLFNIYTWKAIFLSSFQLQKY